MSVAPPPASPPAGAQPSHPGAQPSPAAPQDAAASSAKLESPARDLRAGRPPRTGQGAGRILWRLAFGALLGATAGFAYYWFVGCASGHCLIGANPFLSALFGGLFGLSIAGTLFAPQS
ncbi:MAG: hypothetical protein ACREJ2_14985 [Planctomycetota bacterium]